MRIRLGIAVAAAGLVLSAPAAAWAVAGTPPLDLNGARVLDAAGALGGREDEIQAVSDRVAAETRYRVSVVVVDAFTDAADCFEWAEETAIGSGLGPRDVLLAVAALDEEYCVSVDPSFPLSDAELDAVAARGFLHAWADGDHPAAVTEYIEDLGAAVESDGAGAGDPGADEGSGAGWVLPVIGGAAVVGVGAFAVSRIVRRRKGGATAPAGGASQEELDRRAGGLLVALDDAVRESEQELGFAEAQFGAGAVGAFQTALEGAKAGLAQAFAIRQRLDDAQPETPEQRRALTEQIIALCSEADAALDAQAEDFARLRGLEQNAPEVLARVRAEHAGLEARIAAAEGAIAQLSGRYGAAAVDDVDDSPAQARGLVAFAAEAIGRAEAALSTGAASDAAIAVRDAQQAVGQVGQLLDSVTALETELPRTAERLGQASAALRAAVAEARALPSDGGVDRAALSTAAAAAEQALSSSASGDPVAGLAAVEQATTALDAALRSARDQQAQQAALAQQLDRVRATAEQRISQAESYISTRRGGVGAAARTRIREAERLLVEAAGLAVSDRQAALDAAQQAASHADAALRLARSDVAGLDRSGGGGGIDITSAVLGGLIGGSLSRGGGSGIGGRSGGFGGISRSGPSRLRDSGGSARRSTGGAVSRRGGGGSLRSPGSSGSSRGGRRGGGGRL